MRQIYIANPKGGCGKTTLSIHLATYFANCGLTVALCDHDQQASSIDWIKIRPDYLSEITGIEFFRHGTMTNRFDIVIHDMPGNCSATELADCLKGNQLLIPILPSPTDIRASVRFLMALNRANLVDKNPNGIALIANRVNSRTSYSKVLSAFLNQVNLPVVGQLRDTQNYVRSIDAGVGLFDFPKKTLQQDLAQWQSILTWLDSGEVPQLEALQPALTKVNNKTSPRNNLSKAAAKKQQPSIPVESAKVRKKSPEPRVVH